MNLLIEEHPVQTKEHWEKVYSTKAATHVSWFQEHAAMSLQLIARQSVPLSASIIDVGGGASTLVDDLLYAGYRKLTVLDLSGAAIATAKARLGERAALVQWREANVLEERIARSKFRCLARQSSVPLSDDRAGARGLCPAGAACREAGRACHSRDFRRRRTHAVQRPAGHAL
jgi:SAM-dependent methyltransferase